MSSLVSKLTLTENASAGQLVRGCVPVRAGQEPIGVLERGISFPFQKDLVYEAEEHSVYEVSFVSPPYALRKGQVLKVETAKRGEVAAKRIDLSLFDNSVLGLMSVLPWGLTLIDMQGGEHPLRLNDAGLSKGNHRTGSLIHTTSYAAPSDFGMVQWFLTMRIGSPNIEVHLNFTNGALPARPNAYFKSIRLDLPEGIAMRSESGDPAIQYDADGAAYLAMPNPDGKPHSLPQFHERGFHFRIGPGVTLNDSLEILAKADYSRGGYLPGNFPVPDFKGAATAWFKKNLPDRLTNYALAYPEGAGDNPPPSFLWPAKGSAYGGATGGYEMDCVPWIDAAEAWDNTSRHLVRIDAARYRARHRGALYDDRGSPIIPDDYAEDYVAPWAIYARKFERQGGIIRDDPFGFSKVTHPKPPFGNYDAALLGWDPIDSQHEVRAFRSNFALVALDNDPLARLYICADAGVAMASFWDMDGRARRIDTIPDGLKGTGSTRAGRDMAWTGMLIGFGGVLSQELEASAMRWFGSLARHFKDAQMPMGHVQVRTSGKVVSSPPINSEQATLRVEEEVYMCSMIRFALGSGLVSPAVWSPINAYMLQAIVNYSWDPSERAYPEKMPVGPVTGTQRYLRRSQVDPKYLEPEFNPRYAFQAGIVAALCMMASFDDHPSGATAPLIAAAIEATFRFTQQSRLTEARALMETWGVTRAPGGSPPTNFGPTLAILQNMVGN